MKRTILSLCTILAIAIIILTSLVSTSWADTVTEIKTEADLKAMSSSGGYRLANDITLTEAVTIPAFSGSFDGNGKTISGLSAPLFKELSGSVSNLTLKGEITTGVSTATGVLANRVAKALKVKNVTVDVSVSAPSATGVAGFIGEVSTSSAVTVSFEGCVNKGSVQASANVAGFVGAVTSTSSTYATVTFDHCINEGIVSMTSGDGNIGAGGFVGFGDRYSDVIVEYSSNRANVSSKGGDHGVGGIYGGGTWTSGDNQKFTARYCSNYGDVTVSAGRGRAGGICGRMNRNGSAYTIEYCYNVGTVSAKDDSAAGIFSYTNSSAKVTIKNCYNAGELKNAARIFPIAGSGAASSATSLQNYYVGADTNLSGENVSATKVASKDALNTALLSFDEAVFTVIPNQNNGYAVFLWECNHEGSVKDTCVGTKCTLCGSIVEEKQNGQHSWGDWVIDKEVSELENGEKHRTCSTCQDVETVIESLSVTVKPVGGVYNVKTAGELVWVFNKIDSGALGKDIRIKLTEDIDLKGGLSTLKAAFTGTLDGNGKTLSGITNTLFSEFNGTVTDLTLRGDVDYTASTFSFDVARKASSFAHTSNGATFTNLVSYVNVKTSRNDLNAGGIVGYATGGCTFTNCTYNGNFTANWTGNNAGVGGIIGWSNAAGATTTLTDCSFGGTITVTQGAAGRNASIGGIVGNCTSSTVVIINGTASGTVTSEITAGNDFVGGILGANRNSTTVLTGAVNRATLTAKLNAGGIVGGLSEDLTMDLCANYGKVSGEVAGSIIGTTGDKTLTLSNAVDFSGSSLPLSGTDASAENSFTGSEVTDLNKEFTFDGITYKRYNVALAEKDSGRIVPTLTTDQSFLASFSVRNDGDKHAIRFIMLTDCSKLSRSVTVSIFFKDDDGKTVKSKIGVLAPGKDDYSLYTAVKAAGENHFAANGLALFGCVITDIPNGAWTTVEVSVTDTASGEEYMKPATLDTSAIQLSHSIMPDFSSLGRVSATYNAGPGLLSDQFGTTVQDALMKVIGGTTAEKLANYTRVLENNGYKLVSRNVLDGDTYYTYEKYGKLFYLYHNAKVRETRIIVDNASQKLSEIEVNYTPKADDTCEFYQYSLNYDLANKTGYDPVIYTENTSQNCGMMYVIKLADNSVIVVDGGGDKQSTVKSRAGFLKFLREITKTPEGEKVRIAAWYFSHAHGDHVMLATDFMTEHRESIDLISLLYNFPSYQVKGSGYDKSVFTLKEKIAKHFPDVLYHKLHTGEVLNMAGVTIDVVYTHEDAVSSQGTSEIGDFNSTSTVLKITVEGMSIMLLGDMSGAAENAIVAMHTPAYLKSDMVQVTHHGFNFLDKLYPLINAKIAVFPQSAFYVKDPNNGQSNLYKYQQVMTYSDEEYFAHKYTYKFTVVNGAFKAEALPRYDAK